MISKIVNRLDFDIEGNKKAKVKRDNRALDKETKKSIINYSLVSFHQYLEDLILGKNPTVPLKTANLVAKMVVYTENMDLMYGLCSVWYGTANPLLTLMCGFNMNLN